MTTARRQGQIAALQFALAIVDGRSDEYLRGQLIRNIEQTDDAEDVLELVLGAAEIVAQVLSASAVKKGYTPGDYIGFLVAVNENGINLETDGGARGESA